MFSYHEPVARAMDPIVENKFTVLDLLLTEELERVLDIRSDRLAALASHHFPIIATVEVALEANGRPNRKVPLDWAALKVPQVRKNMIRDFSESIESCHRLDVNARWPVMCACMTEAVHKHIPKQKIKANKPWIQEGTLELVEQRLQARALGDHDLERALRKTIQKSARKDRSTWLSNLAGSGDWGSLRQIKQGRRIVQAWFL